MFKFSVYQNERKKLNLHKFAPSKYVANIQIIGSKYDHIWQTHLPSYLHPLFFGIQMWHLPFLPCTPQYYIFATFLQGANLCKSIFSSSASYWCTQKVWVALKNMARVAVAYTSSNSHATLQTSRVHPNSICARQRQHRSILKYHVQFIASSCYYSFIKEADNYLFSNALDTFITSKSKWLTASCIKRRKYSKYRKC